MITSLRNENLLSSFKKIRDYAALENTTLADLVEK